MSLCFQSYLIDYVVSQDMIKKVIPLRSEEMLHGIERKTLEKAASTETYWIYFQNWLEHPFHYKEKTKNALFYKS